MDDLRRTLDSFITGPENELAFRAARMAAEAPGTLYNPLLIQGPAGTGKTHLLRGMAAEASAGGTGPVILEDAASLAERVTAAIAGGTIPELRSALGGAAILLIDGIETLVGMERTQEELVIIAHDLLRKSRQIVFSSGSAAGEMDGLIPGLRALLQRAVSIDVSHLDRDGRERIAHGMATMLGMSLDDAVVAVIADASPDAAEVERLVRGLRALPEPTTADVYARLGTDPRQNGGDEFAAFLNDIALSLSAVVETAPWRRRIVQSILRWEAEGVDTRRLEQALDSDTAPDVDALIESFDRDATRLLQLRRELSPHPLASSLRDPGQMAAAESLLASRLVDLPTPAAAPEDPPEGAPRYPWFLDPARVELGWVGVDERLAEGIR